LDVGSNPTSSTKMLERTKRPARGAFFILGQARRATLDDGIKFPQTDSNRYLPTVLL